jgi:hypothetical protein
MYDLLADSIYCYEAAGSIGYYDLTTYNDEDGNTYAWSPLGFETV